MSKSLKSELYFHLHSKCVITHILKNVIEYLLSIGLQKVSFTIKLMNLSIVKENSLKVEALLGFCHDKAAQLMF